jgi:hypothetical protein
VLAGTWLTKQGDGRRRENGIAIHEEADGDPAPVRRGIRERECE